jgi:hypothetical protein
MSITVLDTHTGIAMLDVDNTAILALLLSWQKQTVDKFSSGACGATDEYGACSRIVSGRLQKLRETRMERYSR